MINKLNKQIKTIKELLESINTNDENNRSNIKLAIAIEAEKLYLQCRDEVLNDYYNENKLEEFFDNEVKEMGINIYENEDGLFIDMPILLPLKKLKYLRTKAKPNIILFQEEYEHCNAIRNALRHALKQYSEYQSINRSKYSRATYIYTNVYANDFPNRNIPDTDNYEYKQITDTVVCYVSNKDDGYQFLDFKYHTEIGDTNRTILHIKPKEVIKDA